KRNEVQVLTVKQTSGKYTLTDTQGHTTTALDVAASDIDLRNALADALGIGHDQITVSKTSKPDPTASQQQHDLADIVGVEEVYTITFLKHLLVHQLVANVSTLSDDGTFTLVQTNPNLLVDPAAQVNILTVNDGDNPANASGTLDILNNPLISGKNKYPDLDPTLVYGHITGLGMPANDPTTGPDLQPTGITFANMQEVNVNLGTGVHNTFTINTNTGVIDQKLGLIAYTGK